VPAGLTAPTATLLITGTLFGGLLIRKMIEFESPLLPLPEKGFCVNTEALPGVAMSLAGTTAVTVKELPLASGFTNVVASFCEFHPTTVLATNAGPAEEALRVSVKSLPPAGMLLGESDVRNAPVLF